MLTFTVEPKKMTLGKRKGQTVYYAKQVEHQKLPLSVIVERISASTSLAISDVHAAIYALSEVVHQELAQGRSVDLGQLGHIKVGISSKMMDRPEEVTAAVLRTPRVRFYPKDGMKHAARSVLLSVQKRGELAASKAGSGSVGSGAGTGGSGTGSGSVGSGAGAGGSGTGSSSVGSGVGTGGSGTGSSSAGSGSGTGGSGMGSGSAGSGAGTGGSSSGPGF